jgi:glycerophosphoryl diester phosphodiesterase
MTNHPPILNIAHRGARSLAPENTLAAARKGLEIGADLWELDVAMTSDGELVVLHDDTLKRTSNVEAVFPSRKPWAVHTFTFAELRTLDFGSWFNQTDPFQQIAQGAVSPEDQASFVGEPIPTLREALEFTHEHQWRVNVEIKDLSGTPGDSVVVEKVVSLIDELGMSESVIISSFNHSYITRVKSANSQIYTGALIETPVADPVSLLQGTHAQALNPGLEIVDIQGIRTIRQAGFDVLVWTVNEEADMRLLIQAGVSGIFTDFPQRLKKLYTCIA